MLTLVVALLAVLAYTYVGYPLLIAALARLFPPPIRVDTTFLPTVTVCIPAFDAAEYLDRKISSVLDQYYPPGRIEVLVASDGSTDRTADIALAWAAADPRVKVIVEPTRRGKPHALNRMRQVARGEILLLTDARQPLARGALRALVARLADPSVGCVTGNLVLRGPAGSGFYWRYENWIRRNEGRFRSVVGMTGPIAALRRSDMAPLPDDVILDDVWIPMRLRLGGRRVLFCEEAEAYDDAFGDRREFRRKVRTLAGNYQIFRHMPELLLPFVNPSWFETMSHKVLRLVGPWALVLLLVAARLGGISHAESSAGRFLHAVFAAESMLLLAALVGPRGGRVAALARTFVVLNAAALVGLWRYIRGAQKVTW